MFAMHRPTQAHSRIRVWGKRVCWVILVLAIAGVIGSRQFNQYVVVNGGMEATQTKARIMLLELQLNLMKRVQGRYPTQDEGLEELSPKSLREKDAEGVRRLFNDFWGRRIQYRIPGEHHPEGFDLFSYGLDGIEGTEDDIANWGKMTVTDNEPSHE